MPSINFFTEDVSFAISKPRKTSTWIKSVIKKEKHLLKELNFIFCSDKYLHDINLEYLNHKTYTDIITFDHREAPGDPLEGDIFISVERVSENAAKFKTTFTDELHRVMVHGVLHLMGYGDKSSSQRAMMRNKEDASLSLR